MEFGKRDESGSDDQGTWQKQVAADAGVPDKYPVIDEGRKETWKERDRNARWLPERPERNLTTFKRGRQYSNEHKAYFNQKSINSPNSYDRTKAYDDEELAERKLGASGDGLLRRADGSLVDTMAAGATNRDSARAGWNIFALQANDDGTKSIHAADAAKEDDESARRALAARAVDPNQQTIIDHAHHSSFSAGRDVHGAGELAVKQGWVKEVSNDSGHYEPGKESTLQTLDALNEMGVNLDVANVRHLETVTKGKPDESSWRASAFAASRGDQKLMKTHQNMFAAIREGGSSKLAHKAGKVIDKQRGQGESEAGMPRGARGGAIRELERLMPRRVAPSSADLKEAAPTAEVSTEGPVTGDLASETASFDGWRAIAGQRLDAGDTKEADRLGTTLTATSSEDPAEDIADDASNDDDSDFEDDRARAAAARAKDMPDAHRGGWKKFGDNWEAAAPNSRRGAAETEAETNEKNQELSGALWRKKQEIDKAQRNKEKYLPALQAEGAALQDQLEVTPDGAELGAKTEFKRDWDLRGAREDNWYDKSFDTEERKAHELGANPNGLLTRANGELFDTTHAVKSSGDSVAGRNIFGLDHDTKNGRKLYAADAAAENLENAKNPYSDGDVDHIDHESFTEGQSLHGAGELGAKEGWLQTVSNRSGGYATDMRSHVQTLAALDKMGVNTDATKVEDVSMRNGQKRTTEYMGRAVAATGGDRKVMNAHKSAFAQINAGVKLEKPKEEPSLRDGLSESTKAAYNEQEYTFQSPNKKANEQRTKPRPGGALRELERLLGHYAH